MWMDKSAQRRASSGVTPGRVYMGVCSEVEPIVPCRHRRRPASPSHCTRLSVNSRCCFFRVAWSGVDDNWLPRDRIKPTASCRSVKYACSGEGMETGRPKCRKNFAELVYLNFVTEAFDAKTAVFPGKIDERSREADHISGSVPEEIGEALVNAAKIGEGENAECCFVTDLGEC